MIIMCPECYSENSRITPLLNPAQCLQKHTQYICGTCGRCICIECDPKRGLQRWNFPFRTADIARLYLRTADHTLKRACGVYEIKDDKGRVSYKIFGDENELSEYLKKNKNKVCSGRAVFSAGQYREFPDTQVRRLSAAETEKYLSERK